MLNPINETRTLPSPTPAGSRTVATGRVWKPTVQIYQTDPEALRRRIAELTPKHAKLTHWAQQNRVPDAWIHQADNPFTSEAD